jgi:hypothetical protein
MEATIATLAGVYRRSREHARQLVVEIFRAQASKGGIDNVDHACADRPGDPGRSWRKASARPMSPMLVDQ